MTDNIERRLLCVHEAAHAVLAEVSLYHSLGTARINVEDGVNGQVRVAVSKQKLLNTGFAGDTEQAFHCPVVASDVLPIMLGGEMAERKFNEAFPQHSLRSELWDSDHANVHETMERVGISKDQLAVFESRARQLVETHWTSIRMLADVLYEQSSMKSIDAMTFIFKCVRDAGP